MAIIKQMSLTDAFDKAAEHNSRLQSITKKGSYEDTSFKSPDQKLNEELSIKNYQRSSFLFNQYINN